MDKVDIGAAVIAAVILGLLGLGLGISITNYQLDNLVEEGCVVHHPKTGYLVCEMEVE